MVFYRSHILRTWCIRTRKINKYNTRVYNEKVNGFLQTADLKIFATMASLGFDLAFGTLSSNVVDSFVGNLSMDGDEYVRCTKCGYGGCDARVTGCGCTLHAVSCVP